MTPQAYVRRAFESTLLLLVMAAPVGAQPSTGQAPPLVLDALEARALERHPAIAMALADLNAARAHAAQAGAAQNPTVGGSFADWQPRESPSGTITAGVTQRFQLGGKRSADRAVAEAGVREAEVALELARLRVRVAVRSAYFATAAAQQKRMVAERLAAVADEAVVIARQLMNVGLIDRPNLLEAEAEAARQTAMVVAARQHEVASWRRLALAVVDPAMPMPSMAPLVEAAVPRLDRQAALSRVLEASPELRAATASLGRVRAAVAVEQRRTSPDLSLRAEAGWNRERNAGNRAKGWELGLEAAFSVPLLNRNRSGVLSAQASVTAAEATEALLRLDLEARFTDAFEAYERASGLSATYRDAVLPKLEEAMTTNLTRYREMATPYPQVLVSQRLFIEAMGEFLESLDMAWQAAIRVEGLLMPEGGR